MSPGPCRSKDLKLVAPSPEERGLQKSVFTEKGLNLASQHLVRCPIPISFVYSLRLWPFVSFSRAFLGHDCPAYGEQTPGSSVLDSPALPLSAGSGAWEPMKGEVRSGRCKSRHGTWAEGRGVDLGGDQGERRWRPGGTWRRWGEGQVTVRDLAGSLPSAGCGACPSNPRKALLVSCSNARSGDVGPGLHSGG